MGLRVWAAGLKVIMVSIDDLVCQLCIGCSLSLSNNRTKLCVITDIFGLSYFLTGTYFSVDTLYRMVLPDSP